jgi:hypothetical protein
VSVVPPPFGSASLPPSRPPLGGRGSCRAVPPLGARGSCRAAGFNRHASSSAQQELRPPEGPRLPPNRGSERPDKQFGSAGASPSRRTEAAAESRERKARQAVRLSRSFALPKGRGCRRIEGAKGHASSSAQQELRPPEGPRLPPNRGSERPDKQFDSAGASPSRRAQHPSLCHLHLHTGFRVDPFFRALRLCHATAGAADCNHASRES